MNFFKPVLFAAALVSFNSVVLADSPVEISVSTDAVSISPADLSSFVEMHVRVTGPANSATESQSQGDFVWTPPVDSAPGRYTYKVLVISSEASGAERRWVSGSFNVNEYGELIENTQIAQSAEDG